MALRLRVVSEHSNRLGDLATKVFGVHGGTIGRATDNDWMLPDTERYLSGKHARIDFRAGAYILVDISSNGTFVNGAQVPLGKYHDYSLKDGDYVRLGEYELLVSIDKVNDFPPDDGAIVAYDGGSPSAAVKKSVANDLGEDLDLSQLLEPSDLVAADSGIHARDAYGQALNASSSFANENPGNGGTPWHMMTRPLQLAALKPAQDSSNEAAFAAPATPSRAQSPGLYEGDFDIGLSAFCRGAGIDPRSLTSDARNAALKIAGQLLRESILGLMELNQSRNEFRNRFRIPPPPAEAAESPLNFSKGVDEALVRLLNNLSTRAGSIEAVRGNFGELKAQNGATLAATHAAFEEFLQRLDPKELEERFEGAAKRSVFGQSKTKYWELYGEMFAGLAQRPPDGFPHLFTETFAKTYEAKLRALVPPRRTAFGADRSASEPGDAAVSDG